MMRGNTYFGRNLDWSFSYGETILVTPRGYHYDTVFGAGGKAKPNAVIGVGVVMADRPMYFDCANEHGLAIAGLNFPGYASFVHEPVEGTENVATFEFPLWVARNFASVDEVEEALRNVTLVSPDRAGTAGVSAALVHRRRQAQHRRRADGRWHARAS